MKLFLSSRFEVTSPLLPVHFPIPKDIHTIYIPSAANCESYRQPPTERDSYVALTQLGLRPRILEVDVADQNTIAYEIAQAELLVVAGGNTYYLLHHLQRCEFAGLLSDFFRRGGIYVGSSAGSCVCSTDISYIGTQDDPTKVPELTSTRGLGLIDVDLYPHCIEPWYSGYTGDYLIHATSTSHKKLFLRDSHALIAQDNWYKVVSVEDANRDGI
jgi:dipeptidase E